MVSRQRGLSPRSLNLALFVVTLFVECAQGDDETLSIEDVSDARSFLLTIEAQFMQPLSQGA